MKEIAVFRFQVHLWSALTKFYGYYPLHFVNVERICDLVSRVGFRTFLTSYQMSFLDLTPRVAQWASQSAQWSVVGDQLGSSQENRYERNP